METEDLPKAHEPTHLEYTVAETKGKIGETDPDLSTYTMEYAHIVHMHAYTQTPPPLPHHTCIHSNNFFNFKNILKIMSLLGVVIHVCDSNSWMAKAGGSQVRD